LRNILDFLQQTREHVLLIGPATVAERFLTSPADAAGNRRRLQLAPGFSGNVNVFTSPSRRCLLG
jgi:hypothetical protein